MKYHIDWIKEQYDQQQQLEYLFFWGHRPQRNGSLSKSVFSQWWESSFTVDAYTYKSAEHWMMAGKARLFEDEAIFQKILEAETPNDAKKLGRKVSNFSEEIWKANCFEIVRAGNFHKFSSDEKLKSFILGTGNKILVEASPVDPIWGIGMSIEFEGIKDPHQWRGQNLLGFALMEVRDQLL